MLSACQRLEGTSSVSGVHHLLTSIAIRYMRRTRPDGQVAALGPLACVARTGGVSEVADVTGEGACGVMVLRVSWIGAAVLDGLSRVFAEDVEVIAVVEVVHAPLSSVRVMALGPSASFVP